MGIFQQFPYSNFHEMNLDQIIKIMREMQDEWAATKAEWASYKDFIDNYFANLDVSEEVLEALQAMAASGELNTIVDPTIIAAVTAWLADHITQPTTPAIDTSLTIAGAAADAKATGDKINEALIRRANITAGVDMDTVDQIGSYFKDNNITVVNGVNTRAARVVVFKGKQASGYSVVQLWADTTISNLWVRTQYSTGTGFTNWHQIVFKDKEFAYKVEGKTEPGSIGTGQVINGYLNNPSTYRYTRSEKMYTCLPGATLRINLTSATSATAGTIYYYDDTLTFLSSTAYPMADEIERVTPANAHYFKLGYSDSAATELRTEHFVIQSNMPISEVYNPDIKNTVITGSLAFCYQVDQKLASGRLLLPPNYSIDGEKVPLIVFVHGSNCMVNWDSVMGELVRWDNDSQSIVPTGDSYLPLFEYLADEGFAVFDCYPYPQPVLTPQYVDSPFAVDPCIQAYIQGIDYVTTRFNVDKDRVSMICKSQGGHIGQWVLNQSKYDFKAVALFAPSCGIGTLAGGLLVSRNCRAMLSRMFKFAGTAAEINSFVEYGKVDATADGVNVASFVNKNKSILTSISPSVYGITNANADDLFNGSTTAQNTVPQWMLDLGLPARPVGASALYTIANHDSYVKLSNVASKFWAAFDDAEVPAYNVYAVYHWLRNSGSETEFRELPIGTGGHHAMDTDPSAITTSGTTALGITYNNIPVAYVEAVEFINNHILNY